MKQDFLEWVNSDDVIKFDNGYSTQDAQFKNRIPTIKALYRYFIKEFNN